MTANTKSELKLESNTDFWSEQSQPEQKHNYFGSVWYLIAGAIHINGIEHIFQDFIFAASFEEAEAALIDQSQGYRIQIYSIAPEQIFSIQEVELFRNQKLNGTLPETAKLNFLIEKNKKLEFLLC